MIIMRAAALDEMEASYMSAINNNAADDMVKGDVVKWDTALATGETLGKSVSDADAASLLVAGVVRGAGIDNSANVAKGDLVCVQVSGFCDNVTTDQGVSDGDALMAGTAVADTGTLGTDDGAWFGVALADDSTALLSAAYLKGNI